MKLLQFFNLVLILFLLNCNSGNEVLAEFEGGKILRKDLREFYSMRDIPLDENYTSIKNQSAILENISLQTLVAMESENKKISETPIFKKALELSEVQLISNLYMKNFMENLKKNTKLEMVKIQFLLLSTGSPKSESALNDLNGMKSEKEINAYIAENTEEDQRKPIAGFFEPQCLNCADEIYLENVFKEGVEANDDKFHKKELEGKIFIYKVLEKKNVSLEDIKSYFEKTFSKFRDMAIEFQNNSKSESEKEFAKYYAQDGPQLEQKVKMFTDRTKQNFEQFHWRKEFQKLQEEKGYKISEEFEKLITENSGNIPDDFSVINSNQGSVYKYSQLNKEFEELEIIRGGVKSKNPLNEKLDYLKNFVFIRFIISDTEEGKKIKNSEKFSTSLISLKRNIYWNLFIKDIQDGISPPGEKEIKETYEAGKLFAYSEEDPSKPGQKKPLPFDSVKERIKKEMIDNKTKTEMERRVEEMKTKYKLQFFIDKLKAGSI